MNLAGYSPWGHKELDMTEVTEHACKLTVTPSGMKVKVLVIQSCLTLCDPMDCSPPGSSVRGILQARILEWVAISFFGDLPTPGIKPGSRTCLDQDNLMEVILPHNGSSV